MSYQPAAESHTCVLCGTDLMALGEGRILRRYDVIYQSCPACGLITLPDPSWLDEAYAAPIYAGDEGLLRRCRIAASFTAAVIRSERLSGGCFLDWAGGYGTLTRMMRDKGFDYYTVDPYTPNILAPGYGGDVRAEYDLVTAFEVLEHLADPVAALSAISKQTDLMLFSTELQPTSPPPSDWWYYQHDSGQHITFYTRAALARLAANLGFQMTTNGRQFHLFHRGPLAPTTRLLLSPAVLRVGRRLVDAVKSSRERLRASPTGLDL